MTGPIQGVVLGTDIALRIVDPAGAPIEGAVATTVAVPADWTPSADPREPLPARAPSGDELRAVRVEVPGRPAVVLVGERFTGKRPLRDVVAPPVLPLRGIALDEEGRPVAQAAVHVQVSSRALASAVTVTTDGAGRFETRVPHGERVRLLAVTPDATCALEAPWVDPGPLRLALHLKRMRRVTGRLDAGRELVATQRAAAFGKQGEPFAFARVAPGAGGSWSALVPDGGELVAEIARRTPPLRPQAVRVPIVSATGEAAAGAGVRVVLERFDLMTTSDEGGVVALTAPDRVERVVAEHGGQWGEWRPGDVALRLGPQPKRGTAEPDSGLTVRCVDPSGRPIEGALVAGGRLSDPDAFAVAGTDADGVALLSAAVGPELAVAVHPTRIMALGRPASPAVTEIVMRPAARLTGLVVDDDGAPLQDVSITAQGADDRRETLTDAEGRFRFTMLTPGTWRLRAASPVHFQREQSSVEVADSAEVTLRLRRGARVTGLVRDAAGPIEGALVTPHSLLVPPPASMGAAVTTGGDGRFVLEGLPPEAAVIVSASVDGGAETVIEAEPGSDVTMTVARPGRVIVTVLQGETPVAGARVECRAGSRFRRDAVTDDAGVGTITGLRAGTWQCSVESSRGRGRTGDVVVADGGVESRTVTLVPDREVTVKVVEDETGAPIAGASVGFGGSASLDPVTNAEGIAVVRVPGDAAAPRVAARAADDAGLATVEPGVSPTVVRIERSPVIEGVVLDAEGRPALGAEVVTADAWRERTDGGRFRIPVLPGPVTLRAWSDLEPRQEASVQLDVPPGGLRDVVVRLAPVPSGRVSVVLDEPPPGSVEVAVVPEARAAGLTSWAPTGAGTSTGRHVEPHVPSGRAIVFAAPAGAARLLPAGDVVVPAGGEVTVSVRVPAAGRTVNGRVVRHGAPVAGAEVVLAGSARTTTAGDGSFRFTGLPDDDAAWHVHAAPVLPEDAPCSVLIEGDAPATLDVGGVAVTGAVTRDGAPVPDARVAVTRDGADTRETRSGADGRFRVAGLPAGVPLQLTASEGRDRTRVEVRAIPRGGEAAVTVDLRTARLSGRARREDGEPLRAFTLEVMAPGSVPRFVTPVTVEPDGSWTALLPPAEEWIWRASAAGGLWTWGRARPGQPTDIVLPRAATLKLRFRGPSGEPLRAVAVRVLSFDGTTVGGVLPSTLWFSTHEPDADGRWTAHPVAPGAYVLRVEQGSLSARVEVALEAGMTRELDVMLE